jgi:hypothetical protein
MVKNGIPRHVVYKEKNSQVPAFVMSPMVPALPIAAVAAVTALLPKNLPVSVYM